MSYFKFVAFVFLLFAACGAQAQVSNTDRLNTLNHKLWEGKVKRDSVNHTYILTTKDTTYTFTDAEVKEVVPAGSQPRKQQTASDDDFEFASEPKTHPTYILPYEPARFDNPDIVLGKDGTVFKGWVLEDHVNDYVIIRMPDSTNKTISYTNIKRVNYSNYTWTAFSMNKSRADYLPHLHRVGLGLTITGAAFTFIGIPLIAAGSSSATTYHTSTSAGVRLTGAGAVGVLFEVIGIPILIPGIVKLAKYAHLIKAQRNVQPGDL